MTNDERFKILMERVEEYRQLYKTADVYNESLSLEKNEVLDSVGDEPSEEVLDDETVENKTIVELSADNLELDKDRKKYIQDVLLPSVKNKIKAVGTHSPLYASLKKDKADLEREYKDLVKKTRKPRFYYFGLILYPTKNERHYRTLQHIFNHAKTYAFALHYKEFERSMKRIQRECSPVNRCWFAVDVLQLKADGEKFVVRDTDKEIYLIEPHVHMIVKSDTLISKESFCKMYSLETNMVKQCWENTGFLDDDLNPLNYLVHLGRWTTKYNAQNVVDLSSSLEEDFQDRAQYDEDDVVACKKWYNLLLDQIEDFSCRGDKCIEDFSDWVRSTKHIISRLHVNQWFKEHAKYRTFIRSNREYYRPDLLKIVDEHNKDYSEDSYESAEDNISIRALLEEYKQGIETGVIRRFNKMLFCEIDKWHRIKTRVEDMLDAQSARVATVERNLKVVYIQGDSGSGKTTLAKAIAKSLGLSYIVSGSDNDPLEDYDGQDCLILDDFRGRGWSISDTLKMLDNHTSSKVHARYHNKDLYYCQLIIITSVIALDAFWKFLEEEDGTYKEPKKQLERRIGLVAETTPDGKQFVIEDRMHRSYQIVDNPSLQYLGKESVDEIPLLSGLPGFSVQRDFTESEVAACAFK